MDRYKIEHILHEAVDNQKPIEVLCPEWGRHEGEVESVGPSYLYLRRKAEPGTLHLHPFHVIALRDIQEVKYLE